LDVGSGSGYLCAIFHHLIQKDDDDIPTGKVVGIEHIPELADWSISNLKKDGLESSLSSKQIEVHASDGRLGHAAAGPYNAIHVGAAAPAIPEPLIEQLAKPGRMFIPVGQGHQEIVQVDKDEQGNVTKKSLFGVQYVPLTSRDQQEL